ncbi:MAG TPA: hypothetical protein VED41_08625 [Solirubrobacteraceae bacterium]|nr:hypothetical protein [Solirubrobacteraceae bacterium]
MAEIETAAPLPVRRPWWKNGARARGFFEKIEHEFEENPIRSVLVAAGGVLLLDHLIAPKGMSFVSKAFDRFGGHKELPPIPPPIPAAPPLPPPTTAKVGDWNVFPFYPELFAEQAAAEEAAAGAFAGANLQAGWNRGMSPYGPWAVADPMAQYAHAAQRRRTGHMGHYDWE